MVECRDASGGIVVYWDDRVLKLLEAEVGSFSSSCCFLCKESECYFLGSDSEERGCRGFERLQTYQLDKGFV